MGYKKLKELRNTYPSDSENISNSYTDDNTTIKYSGLYPDPPTNNFIDFAIIDIDNLDDIQLIIDKNSNYQFIIEFVENNSELDTRDFTVSQRWISETLYNTLKETQLESNPYVTPKTVATIRVNLDKLLDYWKERKFDIPEKYAEVRIIDTLKSELGFVKHINWLISDTNDELRPVSELGIWEHIYNPPSSSPTLGFEYSQAIDDLAAGKEDIDDVDTDITPPPAINLSPFGVEGDYIGEIRRFGSFLRKEYRWTATGWVKI